MPDIALVIGLLAAVAFLAAVGRRIGLPDPIVFAIGGLALALVPGIPPITLPPSLVLVVFLPPLIFAAAQDTTWAEMRREARPILVLAVGLVLATMVAVAVVAHALATELTWGAAFTLGAIVAPPDTVAAKAIADTLHLPRRLVAILGGEGLVNDATALVAFQVASAAAVAGATFAVAPTALQVLYAPAASVAVGLAVGWIGRQTLDLAGDPAVENTVTLLLPFCAFLSAQAVHASGVLAVVALALYLSRFNVVLASSTSRLQGRVLWEMIDFVLTGLSFILVGLQLRVSAEGLLSHPARAVSITAAVCLTVIGVRPLWVFTTAWLSHSVRGLVLEHAVVPKPTPQILAVLSWAGMRGVISLAVALSLPRGTALGQPFPGRDLIIFITFAVILVTLIGQGLTLPALIRRLGVAVVAGRAEDQEIAAERRMARAALERLEDLAEETGSPAAVADRVGSFYAERIGRLERRHQRGEASGAAQAEDARLERGVHRLLNRLLDVELAELQELQNNVAIDGPVARRLQRGLDRLRLEDRV